MTKDDTQPFDTDLAALTMECTAVELLRASASNLEAVADLRGEAQELLDAARRWICRKQGALVLVVAAVGDEMSDVDVAIVLRQMADHLRRLAESGGRARSEPARDERKKCMK